MSLWVMNAYYLEPVVQTLKIESQDNILTHFLKSPSLKHSAIYLRHNTVNNFIL
jgi:hypothetical protein